MYLNSLSESSIRIDSGNEFHVLAAKYWKTFKPYVFYTGEKNLVFLFLKP